MKFMEIQVSLPCFQERVHNSSPCFFRICLVTSELIEFRLVAGAHPAPIQYKLGVLPCSKMTKCKAHKCVGIQLICSQLEVKNYGTHN
jgi:hypothetical protein